MKALELTGKKFGRLLVVSKAENMNGKTYWNCICECGTQSTYQGTRLTNGVTKSCGCLKVDSIVTRSTTHGATSGKSKKKYNPTYQTWARLKNRCYNKNDMDYPRYGGRGIKVCDQWNDSFESFLNDMGNKPGREYSIDRIDNDGDYTPENCRWATRHIQNNNRSTNHKITYEGKTLTIKQWSDLLGIEYSKLNDRITKLNWPIDKAFKK